jgi:hypothetical protein
VSCPLAILRRFLLAFACNFFAGGYAFVCSAELDIPTAQANGQVSDAAQRGYEYLINTPYLTSDFDQETFDNVWRSWPEPLRSEAESTSIQRRREMAFDRYGLTKRPGDDSGKPLQYVVDEAGNWTMNCLSCHGGSVYGTTVPGSPNNRFALQTMTEELRATKFKIGKALSRMDLGSMVIPLGTTHGTTNAVVFGMGLMKSRDEQLNVIPASPEMFTHHDMDAPPWWYFYKRPYLYIDAFAQKGHRALMQFTLIPENGPQVFRDREDQFRDIYAYLSSLRPPKYDGKIETDLAHQGKTVFTENCSSCHGTYDSGDGVTAEGETAYPNVRVPLDEIGTDSVRLTALTPAGRGKYARSWFAHAGEDNEHQTVIDPDGYVAPPLDGVWASPPYFHNGSVPTLWHVLHPSQRPVVWRRTESSIDPDKVGFQVESVDRVPLDETDVAVRRTYFDTRKFGKGNGGHEFVDQLTETQKTAVLEYLKTL